VTQGDFLKGKKKHTFFNKSSIIILCVWNGLMVHLEMESGSPNKARHCPFFWSSERDIARMKGQQLVPGILVSNSKHKDIIYKYKPKLPSPNQQNPTCNKFRYY
jgi:hypothetical protein